MYGTEEVTNVGGKIVVGWPYSQQETVRGDKRENEVVKGMIVPWQ